MPSPKFNRRSRNQWNIRNIILGVMGCALIMAFYLNVQFHTSREPSNTILRHPKSSIVTVQKRHPPKQQETNNLIPNIKSQDEQIAALVLTTPCDSMDLFFGQVYGYSARQTGYMNDIQHILYDCPYFSEVKMQNQMTIFESKAAHIVKESSTSIHPGAIREWLATSTIKENEYILIAEYDGYFVKEPTIDLLRKQTSDVKNPRGFGQDASWYRPRQPILPLGRIEEICGKDSMALKVKDWRDYAVESPYVITKKDLTTIITSFVAFFDKLEAEEKHLAYPLAIAHHQFVPGISGSLRVSVYGAQSENWDFSDDMKYNPCNMSAGEDLEMLSYPFSVRPTDFVLDEWKQGHVWEFGKSLLPNDIFSCDGWLFEQPPSTLWYQATHTFGYEGVTTILRRRHTFGVCTTLRMYNAALTSYKRGACKHGFNSNQRLRLYHDTTSNRKSALAFGKDQEDIEFAYYGDYDSKKTIKHIKDLKPGDVGSEDVHFVFTTTCTGYQAWQSENLLYSAMVVKQPGRFTRILSMCPYEKTLEVLHRGSSNPKVSFHVVPDYKDHPVPGVNDNNYTPYNKPFGIRHWLRNANPPVKESLIVIIDPDFYFLRPFNVNTGDSKRVVYSGRRDKSEISDAVVDGTAVAQTWVSYLGALAFTKEREEENKILCGTGPECKVSEEDAKEYYAVGPPYAVTRHDLESYIDDYCNITVEMRKLHPHDWMSEMYGYSMSAAKHKVKHTRVDNLAVTLVDTEYWGFVDELKENPCEDPNEPLIPENAPSFIHGCQGYKITLDNDPKPWVFYKQLMPEDMYACDSWLLTPAPAAVWEKASSSGDKRDKHRAYGMCTLIKLMNKAILHYKKNHCPSGYNTNKALRLIDPRPSGYLKIGKNHVKWN